MGCLCKLSPSQGRTSGARCTLFISEAVGSIQSLTWWIKQFIPISICLKLFYLPAERATDPSPSPDSQKMSQVQTIKNTHYTQWHYLWDKVLYVHKGEKLTVHFFVCQFIDAFPVHSSSSVPDSGECNVSKRVFKKKKKKGSCGLIHWFSVVSGLLGQPVSGWVVILLGESKAYVLDKM